MMKLLLLSTKYLASLIHSDRILFSLCELGGICSTLEYKFFYDSLFDVKCVVGCLILIVCLFHCVLKSFCV